MASATIATMHNQAQLATQSSRVRHGMRSTISPSLPRLHARVARSSTRHRTVLRVCAADDAKSLDELRKTTGFGRGKALSTQTEGKLSGKSVEIMQAAWADGGGFSGAWKAYMQKARDDFLAFRDQAGRGEIVDPMMWCLAIAAEDDANSTHSVVELPVATYEKRLTSLVTEFINNYLPDDKEDPLKVAKAVEQYLFETKKFTAATKQKVIDNEMYSPYRVYIHNVLPQVCGAPTVLAAIYISFLLRLQAAGHLTGDLRVVLPVLGGVEGLPFSQLPEEEVPEGFVEASPEYIVAESLTTLKMGYWPWEWIPGHEYGFLTTAQAAIGMDGRFGRGVAGTFVPPKGRPYGDVKRALSACERLVLLRADAFQLRDYGVLLYHVGRVPEAYEALKGFREAYDPTAPTIPIAGFESGPRATEQETELLDQLIKQIEVQIAEQSLELS
eukprot:CAMPEP_0118935856 /NCGR_PEP_ID=MMETSP1169-20130426/15868_1 /TAXON_ID=36882 /ORGANISM="Pyramimonas obovata, Strain CCMP722" /LENGTH=442 /DNA_ID=CAMNT_0006878931 /DNA_START=22 /DNA_END=1350 /DNA_ORIENTATION=+